MAQFLGDIGSVLELFAIAGGLVLLHVASKESARLLKAAGVVLVVGGIAAGVCTMTYWFHYQTTGQFEHATSTHQKH